jgi:hypothetical protein
VANLRQTNLTDHILASVPGVLTTNEFQHVAMTYDRPTGVLTLYRNGVQLAQQAVGTFRTATTADVYLGARPGTTNVFAGLVDEMAIYNRALSASEIALIHQAGAAGKCPEPDGTPYAWFNGVNYASDTVALPDGPPVQTALLSTFTDGTIRYTLDGASPTNGALYTGPFQLTQSGPLRAIAYSTNGTPSEELSTTVQILPAGSVPLNHVRLVSVNGSRVLLVARGEPGRRCVLQRSTDLATWLPIASAVTAADGTAQLRDAAPSSSGAFYRVMVE